MRCILLQPAQGSIILLLLLVHVGYITEICNCRPQQAKSQEEQDRKPTDAQEVKVCLAYALLLGRLQMQAVHARRGQLPMPVQLSSKSCDKLHLQSRVPQSLTSKRNPQRRLFLLPCSVAAGGCSAFVCCSN